jgi:hypothetical protein
MVSAEEQEFCGRDKDPSPASKSQNESCRSSTYLAVARPTSTFAVNVWPFNSASMSP